MWYKGNCGFRHEMSCYYFNAGKAHFFSIDHLKNPSVINVKIVVYSWWKLCMDCLQFLNWIRCFTMFPLLSMPLENWSLEPFSEVSHGVLLYLCQSVIQPYRSVNPTPATSQELFKVRFVVMNPFFPNFPFRSPLKTIGFLMFSRGSKGNIGKKRLIGKTFIGTGWSGSFSFTSWKFYLLFWQVLWIFCHRL